jgi:hypothetical protein
MSIRMSPVAVDHISNLSSLQRQQSGINNLSSGQYVGFLLSPCMTVGKHPEHAERPTGIAELGDRNCDRHTATASKQWQWSTVRQRFRQHVMAERQGCLVEWFLRQRTNPWSFEAVLGEPTPNGFC